VSSSDPDPEDAVLSASSQTVLDLVDGASLLELVLANHVRVRATPGRAAALFEVVSLFFEGCARSSDVTPLLHAFRAEVVVR
jgi:hypothetical protein